MSTFELITAKQRFDDNHMKDMNDEINSYVISNQIILTLVQKNGHIFMHQNK